MSLACGSQAMLMLFGDSMVAGSGNGMREADVCAGRVRVSL